MTTYTVTVKWRDDVADSVEHFESENAANRHAAMMAAMPECKRVTITPPQYHEPKASELRELDRWTGDIDDYVGRVR